MALFLSTFAKKIDKKGRVSVPAQFRAALTDEKFGGIVIYPSFTNACIEGASMSRIEKLSDSIDNLDPFSEDRDAFATAVLGGSFQLSFDSEGRVSIPSELMQNIHIIEDVIFVGKGPTFQIWEPKAYAEYSEKARKLALEKRGQLKASGDKNA